MSDVFIGNLNEDVDEDALRKLFMENDLVPLRITVVRDHGTGKSRGFGFASFDTEDEALAAIGLAGRGFHGRILRIDKARPRPYNDFQVRN